MTLNYDGTTLTELIEDTQTNLSVTESYPVNIPSIVGDDTAYVGFTAASGTQAATQGISSWTFIPGQQAPSDLSAVASSSTQITLAWHEAATTQSGFEVQESIDGTHFSQLATALPTAHGFTVGGLQPETKYWFQVLAANAAGNSDISNVATVSTLTGPGSLSPDFSTNFNTASSLLSLQGSVSGKIPSVVDGALQLTSGVVGDAGTAFTKSEFPITSFSTHFTFQELSAVANGFTFAVQNGSATVYGSAGGGLGYKGIGKSMAVEFSLYNAAGTGPGSSTGVGIDGAAPVGADASENLPSSINFHSTDIFAVAITYNGTTLSVKITDETTHAKASLSYTINIPEQVGGSVAHVGFTASTGGSTAVQDIKTWSFCPAPTVPVALTATAVSGTEIDLSWRDDDSYHAGFEIYRSTDDASFAPLAAIGDVDKYKDTAFSGGVRYYYEVAAVDAAGTSLPSNVATALAPTPPATPTNGHVTLVTATEIVIAWTNNATNAQGYHIIRRAGNGEDTLIATLPANATSYVDNNNGNGLLPGTVYDYHIQCFNVSGFNDFSGVSTMTLCSAPTGVTAAGGSAVTLKWNASTGAATYSIYRATASGKYSVALITGLSATTFTDTDLVDNTTYYYVVTATDTSGESLRSKEVSARVNDVAPVLTNTTPDDGETLVVLNRQITAQFSKALKASSVTTSDVYLTVAGSTAHLAASVCYNASSDTIVLTPAGGLLAGTTYVVTIVGGASGVKDAVGTPMAGVQTWSFSTVPVTPSVQPEASPEFEVDEPSAAWDAVSAAAGHNSAS